MNSMARALSYLIAAQLQAVSLIMLAWWGGNWLNVNHPLSFSWFAITFPVAVLGTIQTFYVVIRHALRQNKKTEEGKKP